MKQRRSRAILTAALAGLAGLALAVPPATASAAPAADPAHQRVAAPSPFTPPTNLRVRNVGPTFASFEWDHDLRQATPGCTLQIFLYAVYRDGRFIGWTLWGGMAAAVSNLRPGTTYKFEVQGRDNCSGQYTPFSAPLFVTTSMS
jgi:hypothetical protein